MEKGGTVDEKVPTVFVAALSAGNLATTKIRTQVFFFSLEPPCKGHNLGSDPLVQCSPRRWSQRWERPRLDSGKNRLVLWQHKVTHWLSFQQTINICEDPKQAFEWIKRHDNLRRPASFSKSQPLLVSRWSVQWPIHLLVTFQFYHVISIIVLLSEREIFSGSGHCMYLTSEKNY